MKIQKFGTIRFTPDGHPIFEDFGFLIESQYEADVVRNKSGEEVLILLSAFRDYFESIRKQAEHKIAELKEKDPDSFSSLVGNNPKSPEEIVDSFLQRMGKP